MREIKNRSIKIWYQNNTPFRQIAESCDASMRQNLASIAREGVEVDVNWLEEGFFTVVPPYNEVYNARNIAQAIYRAERKGYDAAVIGCLLDPGLRATRAIVNIPVTGACESSLLLACCLGAKFSIVANTPPIVGRLADLVRQYGLTNRLASIRTLELTSTKIMELVENGKHQEIVRSFEESAEKTITEDNAEVVIAGCTLLGTLLTVQGVHEIKGVPIIDPTVTALKMAELLVDMRRNLGIEVCRATIYSAAPGWEKEIPIKVS